LNRIKQISNNQLFRITSLNSVSVLVRIAGGLLASKVIAHFIGPGGMAMVGNLRNFLTAADTFSTLGLQNGIIKYTAENEKDEQKLYGVLATVFFSLIGTILLLSLVLLALASYWSQWIFGEYGQYAWVFKVLAFALPWYGGNLVFMAVLNGLGNYKRVIMLNIWGNIAGVLVSALLIWKFATNGAFLGLILYPALLFFFSYYLLQRRFPRLEFMKRTYFDYSILKNMFGYSAMSFVTAILSPVIYLSIRSNLMENFSPDEAGFWEAINRISVFYMLFVTTLLTVYFLPKLSMATTNKETKSIFLSYYKGIVPVFLAGILAIYFLREFIVKLIFTPEFLPMTKLFVWQLLGDFFKVCSLILGYQFFARQLTKAFIVTEIISFIILYFSSILLIKQYGSEGAVMAHALTYGLYLLVLAGYFKVKMRDKIK
jgi:O-antigen/teichoic acid export membrane protein